MRIYVAHGIPQGKEDKKLEEEVMSCISTLSQAMYNAQETADRNRDSIKQRIVKKVPVINGKVKEFMEKIQDKKFLTI